MTITEKLRHTIKTGERVTVNLSEAAALTGSGSGGGGRAHFDEAFAALRYANPFRQGARIIAAPDRSDILFVAKTGNATNPANPWGYTFTPNDGTPGTATVIWQLPIRNISASLPIRTAALEDINALEATLLADLALEFSAIEAESMAVNSDQAGSVTTATGATSGLRGLDSYASAGSSAYGTSGTAITNGVHSVATIAKGAALEYTDIVALATALPGQYWSLPGTAWHIKPSMITSLRSLVDGQGLPIFMEVGEKGGAAVGYMYGFPVIPNDYLSTGFPIYLANWPEFMTIADVEEMTIQMFEQTAPGFVTFYCEKRVASSVRNPFAGVRMSA